MSILLGTNHSKEFFIHMYDEIFKVAKHLKFYNYGYLPLLIEDSGDGLINSENLYHYAVSSIDLDGKNILEVGCGKGGGINSLSKHYNLNNVSGCDINENHIEFCKDLNSNIQFDVADAELLPYDDNSFDVLINIESSHCYGDIRKFFKEVDRVLINGGKFVWVDFFDIESNEFENKLEHINLKLQSIDDITNNTKDASVEILEMLSKENQSELGVSHSKLQYQAAIDGFDDGEYKYMRVVMEKNNAKV